MALDTRSKRTSAIGVSSPWRSIVPVPDGAIGQGDRQAIAYYCEGVLFATDAPQSIGLWHNLALTSYDTNTSGADTVPMQTRNVDMAQVIQVGIDP